MAPSATFGCGRVPADRARTRPARSWLRMTSAICERQELPVQSTSTVLRCGHGSAPNAMGWRRRSGRAGVAGGRPAGRSARRPCRPSCGTAPAAPRPGAADGCGSASRPRRGGRAPAPPRAAPPRCRETLGWGASSAPCRSQTQRSSDLQQHGEEAAADRVGQGLEEGLGSNGLGPSDMGRSRVRASWSCVGPGQPGLDRRSSFRRSRMGHRPASRRCPRRPAGPSVRWRRAVAEASAGPARPAAG